MYVYLLWYIYIYIYYIRYDTYIHTNIHTDRQTDRQTYINKQWDISKISRDFEEDFTEPPYNSLQTRQKPAEYSKQWSKLLFEALKMNCKGKILIYLIQCILCDKQFKDKSETTIKLI